ncbi:MAG: LysM peptidoglycan-binding domain-containing protein [Muribaculaceae bacterium]|jgi:membrane-bound lytic murein transglycosylase D
MKLTAISAFLALLAAVPAVANNVLSVSDASMTPTAIMPQSAETDTRKMLENWYLQNYTVLDTEADSRESAELTDEIIMDRLSRLPVSIEMPFNSVVGNSIRFYAKRRQLVENMLGLSIYYMPIFEEALERHGLPRELRYLPVIESALVPTAKSRAGAGGLWQFMPATGAGLGLEQNSLVDMRFDPYKSSEAAAIYLKQLYSTYNDWSLAIAAYNCGPGNVNKAIRRAGGGKKDFWEIYPFLLPETRGYVPAFIAANYIMTYHKNHNISPVLARRPIVVDTVHVSRRVHFDQISEVLDIPMEELRALNPQYRRDIIPGDIKPYPLTLPSLQAYAYVANEDSIVNHNASRYARRGVVEPSTGAVTGSDSRGEYVEEETIQWHKVRRGETLTSIARRYGTTVREIRRLNNCGKRVATGKRLKIKTVVRHYKEPEPTPAPTGTTPSAESSMLADSGSQACDSASVEAAAADSTAAAYVAAAFAAADSARSAETVPATAATQSTQPSQTEQETASRTTGRQTQPQSQAQPQRPRTIRHKVKRGESLSKIARRYGTTVRAIQRANNLTSTNLQIGQRLIIPQ